MDPLKGKVVLISGSTGFLGSHLVRYLITQGSTVVAITRSSSSLKRIEDLKSKIEFVDSADLATSLKGRKFDYFFHLATCYGRNNETKEYIYNTNVDWPIGVLNLINHKDLVLVNFASSLPSGLNYYTQSKAEFADKARTLCQGQFINLKLEQFYGPLDGTFISFIFNQLLTGTKPIPLTEGLQLRDFIYYKDVLTAIDAIIRFTYASTSKYYEISIGSGKAISIREAVTIIQQKLKASEAVLQWGALPYRKDEPMVLKADIRALNNMGWVPKYSFESAMDEMSALLNQK